MQKLDANELPIFLAGVVFGMYLALIIVIIAAT